jgi:hypothetical protein
LANAQHIKNVPGRKTDQKDAEWIAQLLQYGLLRPRYVPCEIIRDLRDLTRMRASLSQEASRISSRIQKVLEDANVKLASVATNVLGKSAFCFGVYWIKYSSWNTKLHCSTNAWRTSADKDRTWRKWLLAGTRYRGSIEWQRGLF